jgi:hypothetical protein
MSIELLLSRLDKVKRTPNGYMACCPAHDDKTPSLSIRETDGKILIHCWTGCSALEIVDAIGLTLNDLFDEPISNNSQRKQLPFSHRDALTALAPEILLVGLCAADMAKGRSLSDSTRKRLELSASRLTSAHSYCEGL